MMRIALAVLCMLPAVAAAKVVNVEFKFTPYTGDTKADVVQKVPGRATVFLNNVYLVEQEVDGDEVPVLFDDREVAPAVWIPVASLGPLVRKGANKLRIEFQPTDASMRYKALLRWVSVTDSVVEESEGGRLKSSNQVDEGKEEQEVTGRVVMEREFVADFAAAQPWHSYPPVTAVTPDDKHKLAALLRDRAAWFRPDFAKIYEVLKANGRLDPGEVRKVKCLQAAYDAGLRFTPAPADQLQFLASGGPEVVVRRRGGPLFDTDQKAFERIKGGDDVQMCAGMALSVAYPARLIFVRSPDGSWEAIP